MWNSIRIRLTVILIGLAIGPLLLVGAILAQQSFALEREQALDLQQQVAQRVAAEVESYLLEVQNDLRRLSGELHSLEQPDRAQQLSLLLTAFNSGTYRQAYEEFTVLDGQGREQLRVSRETVIPANELGNRVGADEYEQPKASRQTYFGPIEFNETNGEPFMTMAIPLFQPRSVQLDAVLVTRVRFRTVGNLISEVQVSTNQTIYLVDSDGKVVAHEDSSLILRDKNFVTTDLANRQTGLEGADVVLGDAPIRQLGEQTLTVVAERPTAEALESAYSTVYTIVGIIVFVLIIAGALGFWVVRQIVRPIEAMSTTAQAISAGDLSQQVKITSRDELGTLAGAFNSMTAQLRNLIDSLETRVEERTRALQASAEISRELGVILDFNQLLQTVVNLIQREFNFYHTHIYLFDEETNVLTMAEGSGDVGRQLKEKGHTLQVGQGIVGSVASSGEALLVSNVDAVPNFFRNPLLPKTQSELAVPLRKAGQTLGVLDIQSDELHAFTEADLTLMQSIADQLAIAVDNARLFQEAQVTLAEVKTLNRQLTHEAWYDISHKIDTTGYVYTKMGLAPAPTEWIPTMTEAVQQKNLISQPGSHSDDDANGTVNSLAIPLTLRGEIIGIIGIERSLDKAWTQDELVTVQTISEQVALALDTARLARKTERAAWRDHVVSESTAKVWSSAEIEEVMQAAVAQLGDKLRASEVVIRLGTERELAQE